MNPYALVLAFLAILGAIWVWAELRAGIALRLASGALMAASLAYAASYIGGLGPKIKITFYEAAISDIALALESGNSQPVLAAIRKHETERNPQAPNPIGLLAALRAHASSGTNADSEH